MSDRAARSDTTSIANASGVATGSAEGGATGSRATAKAQTPGPGVETTSSNGSGAHLSETHPATSPGAAIRYGARPRVSVLIVSYKSADDIKRCVDSLLSATHELDLELVIVDNNSPDDTVARIQQLSPTPTLVDSTPPTELGAFPSSVEIRLIASDQNHGFGRAVNLAASHARGDWFILLNPDTEVFDGSIDRLIAFAKARPGAGLVGGRTVRPDGVTEPSSAWGAPSPWSAICFGLGLSSIGPLRPWFDPESLQDWNRESVREVGVITGCLLATSREVWSELEGFDPDYFMYSEDTDLSMRATAAGYQPVVTPDAKIMHAVGASSAPADRRVLIMRGKATLIRRHFNTPMRKIGLAMLLLGSLLRSQPERLGRPDGHGNLTWGQVWAERSSWIEGWPSAPGGHRPEILRRNEVPTS